MKVAKDGATAGEGSFTKENWTLVRKKIGARTRGKVESSVKIGAELNLGAAG